MNANKYDALTMSNLAKHERESSKPLIENPDNGRPRPPLAGPEIDDFDDRDVVTRPYPGVDDGFFNTDDDGGVSGGRPAETDNPDVETIPPVQPRAGGDGESESKPEKPEGGEDKPDGAPRRDPSPRPSNFPEEPLNPSYPNFPYAPGFGIDIDTATNINNSSLPDINVYQHKKTLAQGMMDLALFSANANQLRYVLESYDRHPYYYPSLAMISISLIFQIAVGVGLIWNSRYNVKDEREICIANKINNFTIMGIFLITVINVFISAFGVASINPTTT